MKLAVIPARGGSKRILRKNVRPFAGRPIIAYTLDAARDSGIFDEVHVSTDDDEIRTVARELGFDPGFSRDPALADDHSTLAEVLNWVTRQYAARGRAVDVVCNIMACAPLIDAEDLRAAHRLFAKHAGAHPVISVVRSPQPVERALIIGPEGRLAPRDAKMMQRRTQDLPASYFDAGAFAFFDAAQLAAVGRVEWSSCLPFELPAERAVDIDEEDDFRLAEAIYFGTRARGG